MRHRLASWTPVLMQMAALFWASSIENVGEMPGQLSDKTVHAVAYAVLGLLAIRATSGRLWSGVGTRSALRAWFLTAAYGLTDEWHQRFVPGRTAAWDDWMADVAGAGIAIALVLVAAIGRNVESREV